jgi:LPXTG-motif cell wall-anchored protein
MHCSNVLKAGPSILAVVSFLGAGTVWGTGIEICDNGQAETRGGLIDCANPDCVGDPACPFGRGCCVLYLCQQSPPWGDTGEGAGDEQAVATCFEALDQEACASYVGPPLPCGTDSPDQECLTDGLVCQAGELVAGSCQFVEACPQFAAEIAAPAASAPVLAGLVLLLAAAGVFYVRRRRS